MRETEYRLYVPSENDMTHIDAGSAIVGEVIGDLVAVDYERGGASNVRTFEDRITHAAGRRSDRYPTSARTAFERRHLVDVGSVRFDHVLRRWVIGSIDDPERLARWAPGEHVVGGSPNLRREAAGSAYARLNSIGRVETSVSISSGVDSTDAVLAVAARPGRTR